MHSRFEISFQRRLGVDVDKLSSLFEAAWGDSKAGYEGVLARSFGWVTAHHGDQLIGFVNIAWDGGVHFFLLDTTVHPDYQRQGIGSRLVHEAIEECRGKGEWVHVDAEEPLMSGFYIATCGFSPTPAGLLKL